MKMSKHDTPKPTILYRNVGVNCFDQNNAAVPNATVVLKLENVIPTFTGVTNKDGYVNIVVADPQVPGSLNTNITVKAVGYKDYDNGWVGQPNDQGCFLGGTPWGNYVLLPSMQLAASPWPSLDAIRNVRGAIWSSRSAIPFGPRPNQPDNINAMDYFASCYDSAQRQQMISDYKSRKLTHVAVGPFVDPGYHGQYPAEDFRSNPDEFAAKLGELRNAGLILAGFLCPDGWSLDQCQSLNSIFSQAKWQDLFQIVVPCGWEPSEDTPNSEYVAKLAWGKQLFPRALVALHLAADFDCPGNNADLTPGTPQYIGMAQCWANVCKYLNQYFVQNGPYTTAPSADPTLANNFANLFNQSSGSLWDRFHNGYAGWPTFSAWGAQPIDIVAAEQTSYSAYWSNLPEQDSKDWGTLAVNSGANGAFDSIN